jgi:ParB family chromosome partitioning protein
MTIAKKQSLGRGLSALLGEEADDYTTMDRLRSSKYVAIEQLFPSPYQPRRRFDETEMQALVNSVQEKGVLQPLLVRRDKNDAARYEIIAGERRWRAAKAVGLQDVPVVIKELSDRDVLEVALIENVQRQDLSAIEEADGYQKLINEFGHTQDELARVIGKSRSHIANMLRLLKLPVSVQQMLEKQHISMGHARALINLPDPEQMAQDIIARHLTVRDIEKIAQNHRDVLPAAGKSAKSLPTKAFSKETQEIEKTLGRLLGLRVRVRVKRKGGTIAIEYQNTGELKTLIHRLSDVDLA